MRILLVDDSEETLAILAEVVAYLGHEPVRCTRAEEALTDYETRFAPLVLTDLRMPGMDGLALLDRIKNAPRGDETDVIIVTGHGDMETAIEALRKGAYDFLNKPVNAREVAAVVERAAEHRALLRENRELTDRMEDRVARETRVIRKDLEALRMRLRRAHGVAEVVAASEAMRRLLEGLDAFHRDPGVPVLIEGETGTGKEIVARLIHFGADPEDGAADLPFVDINCTALAPELVDSELFGYTAGAFTGGAPEGAAGKLELAGKGTLFLDEIGDMPLDLQPKLLRVLQERTYYRVGGLKQQVFEARIVCATNRPVQELLASGRFRRDLYHRLNVGHLRIPPLRERKEDVLALARHFLRREAERRRRRFEGIDREAEQVLLAHPWPGNVRELENVIERVVLLEDDDTLRAGHLRFLLETAPPGAASPATSAMSTGGMSAEGGGEDMPSGPHVGMSYILDTESFRLPDGAFNLEAHTHAVLRKALAKFDGNKSQAARYLGISRHALQRRLQKMEAEETS